MQFQVVAGGPITLGWLVALLVLILAIIFAVLNTIPLVLAGLIGGVALARLL
jgi:hypothetical protein